MPVALLRPAASSAMRGVFMAQHQLASSGSPAVYPEPGPIRVCRLAKGILAWSILQSRLVNLAVYAACGSPLHHGFR